MFDSNHIIKKGTSVSDALFQLNQLKGEKILFIVDERNIFSGSITDGDIRRGILNEGTIGDKIESFSQKNPKYFFENNVDLKSLIKMREEGIKLIPILSHELKIKSFIDFNELNSFLPLDTVIMAGGKGSRLAPLTASIPKPLLEVGEKPIMEHNVDRLISYGIKNFWFSVNYLKDLIINHFKDGKQNTVFNYIEEKMPMGTIGSLSMVEEFKNDHILVANSDVLTNLDYEKFYLDFLDKDADISMVTIPYEVAIPYGIIEHKNNNVKGLVEKPTYTYYSNAGIYLIKREILHKIPKNKFFNATDLIEKIIKNKGKVISYPFSGYWLDIGKPDDFKKANLEINTIKF